MTRPTYFIRVALHNITRNLAVNLVSAGIISVAFLILGAFLLIQVNLQALVESSTKGLSLSVNLKDGLSRPALEKIQKQVAGIPGVTSNRYISKDQALEDLKERLGDQGSILEDLDENPLPASLELNVEPGFLHKDRIGALMKEIKAVRGVAEVHYAREWADKLAVVINFVKIGGFIVGAFLFLATIFIIANTIRLTVMARREELYIMRLMGATETFIRAPFIIEGLLQGFLGGLVALGVLYALFKFLLSQVELPFGLALVSLTFLPRYMSWALLAAGPVLGFWGSCISLRKVRLS